ncbi:hypothetical protein ABL78_0220 [Leptomonas seymouri]|uniref:Protein kinase domain-containing protein n=1 Tax=Leptomonas seymouri TaxID=5684 RepID=A0A0N1IML3_LEPSE|nr:hypothetical protein ABL78_0220 [Leptomonas seymouri]|eukprot:KPI90624.1 hypothetical protein ABL78_0220 [Leptomonas seymouri]
MGMPPTPNRFTSRLPVRAVLLLCLTLILFLGGYIENDVTEAASSSAAPGAHAGGYLRAPRVLVFARAAPVTSPLPPPVPAEPWHVLNESLLPYPIFYAATAILDNSVVLLGGCTTTSCAIPVGQTAGRARAFSTTKKGGPSSGPAISPVMPSRFKGAKSPYHERSIALDVKTKTMTPLTRLTLPAGLGFAGRHAAVTLTDSVYVPRSCTMTTLSPESIADMSADELQALQEAYAPVVAFYPEETKAHPRADGAAPAVNISYYKVPAERVRVNASCTALATENKILIIGGFLLSTQSVTASVDAFNVVTRKYESEVVFLSSPVLQPSVAASTGFAAVAGGWTYTMSGITTQEHRRQPLSPVPSSSSSAASASLSPAPPTPTIKYLFDLLFFESGRLRHNRQLNRSTPRSATAHQHLRSSSSICLSPVGAELLPRDVLQHILLAEHGCRIEVFGGQVVLTDHSLAHIAVLDVRATSVQTSLASSMKTQLMVRTRYSPPLQSHSMQTATQKVGLHSTAFSAGAKTSGVVSTEGSGSEQSTTSSHESAVSSASSSPPPPPSPSPEPAPTLPPEPVYHYRWEQPILISLPLSRRAVAAKAHGAGPTMGETEHAVSPSRGASLTNEASDSCTSTTTTTAEPTSTPAPDANTSTDTILVFMALGGEDVWTRKVPERDKAAVGNDVSLSVPRLSPCLGSAASSSSAPNPPHETVICRTPAQRWAQRYVPDSAYDADRDDLLSIKMPTPIWPADLTLQTTSEGTIQLGFPDVNYTRYCSWASDHFHKDADREEEVVCAVRLSSRRDCVGNTAGTLDTVYSGAPNASVLFRASGSTTPVYACFGYVVQPISLPTCSAQHSFSVLNPMMPLRILDNTPTLPPPAPNPTRDPSDKTTSSPLFMVAVGISVVTLMVAVLLVARLQHVPEEGLLVEGLFARGYTHNAGGGGGSLHGHYARVPGSDVDLDVDGEVGGPAPHREGTDGPLTQLADFQQLVVSVAEANEALMLKSAADVLCLHQRRYRILSRVGQGDHSLCFLALRKPNPAHQPSLLVLDVGYPPAAGGPHMSRRGVPRFPATSFPGLEATAASAAGGGHAAPCSTTSSLWAARYDQKAAVVVKYTRCPDDTTRAVITRMCERLRDLQASGGVHSLASMSSRSSDPSSRRSRANGGAAMGWLRDQQQRYQQHNSNYRHTSLFSEVPSCVLSGISDTAVNAARAGQGASADAFVEGSSRDTQHHTTSAPPTLPHMEPSTEAHQHDSADRLHQPVDRESAHCNQESDGLPSVSTAAAAATAAANKQREPVKVDGEAEEEDVCPWLDAHEIDVVLSLFLLLPADLFVSYEVSVLQQQQQQQQRQPHHAFLLDPHRGTGLAMGGGVARQSPSLYPIAAQWNRQCMYVGQAGVTKDRRGQCSGNETTRQASKGFRDRFIKKADSTEKKQNLSPAARAFVASLASGAPRMCWDACVNPLQPPTVSAWSLCLVMPYERAGDLAGFVRRARQLLPADAWQSPNTWGCNDGDRRGGLRSTAARWTLALTKAKHCWSESLLCSLLFQISAGLQLLHQQSPPILQGDLKDTNVLLREPTVFSVASRRVHTSVLRTSEGNDTQSQGAGIDPLLSPIADGPSRHHPSHAFSNEAVHASAPPPSTPGAFGLAAASLSSAPARRTGNVVVEAAASVWRAGNQASPPAPTADASSKPSMGATAAAHDQHLSHPSPQLFPPPAEWYLSTKTYLPVSLTDGGMSWWLAVQLPQRLRGCFGFTTHSTLRQTPAGRCWLSRYQLPQSGGDPLATSCDGAPPEEAVAGLAHFLFCFIEVPTHIAPELIWGQLCQLSSAAAVGESGSGGVGVRGDAIGLGSRQPAARQPRGADPLPAAPASHAVASFVQTDGCTSVQDSNAQRGPPASQRSESSNGTNTYAVEAGDASRDSSEGALMGDAFASETVAEVKADDTKDEEIDEDSEVAVCDEADDEEGVFSPDEVSILTSTMWKAEGLTRVSRQLPRERANGSVDRSTRGGDPISAAHTAAAVRVGGVPSSMSNAAVPISGSIHPTALSAPAPPSPPPVSSSNHAYSPLLPPYKTYRFVQNPHSSAAVGGGNRGGGSQSNSSVYEMLIQRVLAMDTASDVWSLGVLLYGMCTDALTEETEGGGEVPVFAEARHTQRQQAGDAAAADASTFMSNASRLAQRAFAALLGDLFALAYGSPQVHEAPPATATAESLTIGNAGSPCDEDRVWWPRSCALESEVEDVFLSAGYSSTFAQLMARMLSPVAARRPPAAEIVDQVRLVVPTAAPSSTVASQHTNSSSPAMTALSEVPCVASRPDAACDKYSGRAHSGGGAAESDSGDCSRTAATVLNESTALMKLRKRSWC